MGCRHSSSAISGASNLFYGRAFVQDLLYPSKHLSRGLESSLSLRKIRVLPRPLATTLISVTTRISSTTPLHSEMAISSVARGGQAGIPPGDIWSEGRNRVIPLALPRMIRSRDISFFIKHPLILILMSMKQ